MASRDFLKHVVSTSEPVGSALGDEYYNPSSNKLYKRLAVNGTSVQWVERQQALTVQASGVTRAVGARTINFPGATIGYDSTTDTLTVQSSGIPGGSDTHIQFNSVGSFAGSSNLTWNGSLLNVTGRIETNGSRVVDYKNATAQWAMSGGGLVTWTGASILWNVRVICIPVENNEMGSSGHFDITCPTSGTVVYYNSANVTTTLTATAAGIPMGAWEALYYEVTEGMSSAFDQTRFRVVNYQNTTWRPSTGWLLIAAVNGDGTNIGHIKWMPGQVNLPTTGATVTYNTGTGVSSWASATGTVTAVSVASANGFAGTSSGGATPALTLTTSITGLLKGNGTAISAATAGTDYLAPAGTFNLGTTSITFNRSSAAQSLTGINIDGTAGVGTTVTTTASTTNSDFKIPLLNTTGVVTGNFGLLLDSSAAGEFTYNPSTNVLTTGIIRSGTYNQTVSQNNSASAAGFQELFRIASSNLTTSGTFALSATRGGYVHGSNYTWTSTHNGTGQGTLIMLTSGQYSNIDVALDVAGDGSVIISANWGAAQTYGITVNVQIGGVVSFATVGTAWTAPNTGYNRRVSFTTFDNGTRIDQLRATSLGVGITPTGTIGAITATNNITIGSAATGVTRSTLTSNGTFESYYLAEATPRITIGRDIGVSGGAGIALGGSTYALLGTNDSAGTNFYIKLASATATVTTSPTLSLSSVGLALGTLTPAARLHIEVTGQASTAAATIVKSTDFAAAARVGFSGLANNSDGIFFGMGANGTGIPAGFGFFREATGWNTAIAFYTNNITSGPNSTAAMQEKMRLDSAGSLRAIANVSSTSTTSGTVIVTGGVGMSENLYVGGLMVQGGLYSSTTRQLSLVLGTETWVRLGTFTNRCAIKILIGAGSNNSEEESEIEIFGTYTLAGTQIHVKRQTYNLHLREVRVTQTAGGAPKIVYVRLRTTEFAPNIDWRLVKSRGVTSIENVVETPAAGESVLVEQLNANINNAINTLTNTTASTSTTTGALVVTGGAGISGDVYTGGQRIQSIGTGLTAAGTTQGTALLLAKQINDVTVVAASSGVRLPVAVAGMRIIVRNSSVTNLNVYPNTGAQIQTLGANVAMVLVAATMLEYVAVSTTQWYLMNNVYA